TPPRASLATRRRARPAVPGGLHPRQGIDMRSFFTALAVLLLLAAQAATALAQTAVTGTVRDADTGEPLPGASVVVAGTTRGTTTAGDGTFRLDLDFRGGEPVAALVFSYVGYEARTVA